MNIKQINTAIMQGDFTNEQLVSIGDAIKFARAQLAVRTKRTLSNGASVKFISSRDGREVLGTVTKINRKFVIVNETAKRINWRVPANMLQIA